jgi:hypothetical protein
MSSFCAGAERPPRCFSASKEKNREALSSRKKSQKRRRSGHFAGRADGSTKTEQM